MTVRIMIDTSIWLDLLKDQRLDPVLTAIEELASTNAISLIVPEQVLFEFDKNKERVKDVRKTNLVSTMKKFREVLGQLPPDSERDKAYEAIDAINHKVALSTDTSESIIQKIFDLLAKGPVLATTDNIKLRAADRSLARMAPCHQTKNSIADAIILETYLAEMMGDSDPDNRYVFVTSNTADFSTPVGDRRLPHPDLEPHFPTPRSDYATQIAEVIHQIDSNLLDEFSLTEDFLEEPRSLSELVKAENLLFRQVWYNRHRNLRHRVSAGEMRVVDEIDLSKRPIHSLITHATWSTALEAAKRTEEEVGLEHLGPWDDFEWGMINGKLSAIRWVLGSEWDFLDT